MEGISFEISVTIYQSNKAYMTEHFNNLTKNPIALTFLTASNEEIIVGHKMNILGPAKCL